MKKTCLIMGLLMITCLFIGCSHNENPITKDTQTAITTPPPSTINDPTDHPSATPTPTEEESYYLNITQEEAKQIMDSDEKYIILDVRTEEEYAEGHIPGAVLIPYDEILENAEEILQDKNTLLLVYCRSGNRSKTASTYLQQLGYKYIKEFGGIIDWQYEIVQ